MAIQYVIDSYVYAYNDDDDYNHDHHNTCIKVMYDNDIKVDAFHHGDLLVNGLIVRRLIAMTNCISRLHVCYMRRIHHIWRICCSILCFPKKLYVWRWPGAISFMKLGARNHRNAESISDVPPTQFIYMHLMLSASFVLAIATLLRRTRSDAPQQINRSKNTWEPFY